MAARIRKQHQDEVRAKIQGSQLVNYLQDHALKGKGSDNSNTRVRAAVALLAKIVPDLSQVSGAGEAGDHLLTITHEAK